MGELDHQDIQHTTQARANEDYTADNQKNNLREHITVECPIINKSTFRSTINYTEAKEKIFIKGLGLSQSLLSSVKMTFNKHPSVHFKLKKGIDITTLPNPNFNIERKYHSAGTLITDVIQCKVMGMPRKNEGHINKTNTNTKHHNKTYQGEPPAPDEQTVRINGINSISDVAKVKKWLQQYGELLNEITEEHHHDPDPKSDRVVNGIYTVKMIIKK